MSAWRKVRFWRLAWLCHNAPEPLRWRWEKVTTGNRTRLRVVSPRGVGWYFKLSGGAWLKKDDESI